MGKTNLDALVENDKAPKKKAAKGAPKARKERGRTTNRRRERAMRKALKAIEVAEDPVAAAEMAKQLDLMKAAQARILAKMGKK